MAGRNEAREGLEKSLRKIAMGDGVHGWGDCRDAEEKIWQTARGIIREAEWKGLTARDVLAAWDAVAAVAVEGFARFRSALAELAAREGGTQ